MCSVEAPVSFEMKTKCCTYVPSIPNFLAGKILENNVAVFEFYWDRADVRPQGVWPDRDFVAQYHPSSPRFGRNLHWRCPYYLEAEGGLCGIWEHRNGRCATWFCKHLRGKISHDFWSSIEALLTSVEKILSLWCIHQLKAGTTEFREAFPIGAEEPVFSVWLKQQSFYEGGGATRDLKWGAWLNRERDFFCECYRLIAPLKWKDVRKICGSKLDLLEQNTLKSYDRLTSDFFPDILKLSDFKMNDISDEEVCLWTVNPYDPVTLSKTTLRLLHRKNGTPMQEVTTIIPKELLLRLFDAGILI